jgi:hypothetical protein
MTKRLPYILLLLTLTSNLCFGQKDFKPGYIITNDLDTVYGLINLKSNYLNGRSCEFKSEKFSVSETLNPLQIKGYKIENSKFYISREITSNNKQQHVFLEYLLDGIVDLFYLKELIGEYFFIEKEGVLYELSNEEKVVLVGNYNYFIKSNQYKGILITLFQDSPETTNEIKNTDFGYKQLIALTKDYHNYVCEDQECIDYTKSTKTRIVVEPNAGTSFSWMGYSTSEDYAFNLSPYGGINIRFMPFRSHYAWNFATGLNFSPNDISGNFTNSLFNCTFEISTKYTMLRIPLTVEYNFPAKKIQPYVSISYNNIFLLNREYEVLYVYSESPNATPFPYASDLRAYQFGLTFDLGIRYILTDSFYVYLKNELEFRKSVQNLGHALDYHRVYSEMINFGIGFTVK